MSTIVKKTIASKYNKRVLPREIKLGDIVLRRANIREANVGDGKLVSIWEGPYKVKTNMQS